MTPSEMAVDVQTATEEEVRAAIAIVLEEAGMTLSELVEEGRSGRFSSDTARMAWWVVSPFVDANS